MDATETIKKIEELVRQPGFLYTLCTALVRDMFHDPQEVAEINWHEHLSFQEFSFLIGLLIKEPIDLSVPTPDESARQFEAVYALFLELHKTYAKRLGRVLNKEIIESPQTVDLQEMDRKALGAAELMVEPIFYADSGAYDFQYWEFATQKYEKDERWILRNAGIGVREMAEISKYLKALNERKFRNMVPISDPDFGDICKAALSVFCFEPAELESFGAETVASFLRAFSLIPGTVNAKLNAPGQYNELESHPVIQLPDGRYFLPVVFNLSKAIYESPFYWMNLDDVYRTEALGHRGEFAQTAAAELLAKVFGAGNVHTQVEVRKTKNQLVTDIDVLAIAGNKAVVVQVKSKRLTELAKLGDAPSLNHDFQKAVQDAYEQGLASRRAVINKDHRLCVDGKELHLDERIDEAYILCVTLDHYPAVAHQVEFYLQKAAGDPFPIAISIFDLDILAFYLRDPFEFLYYLRQRISLYEHYKADNEMSLLGWHLKYKLFRKHEADLVMLDNSFAQLVDANFPVQRGSVPKTSAADKLYTKWKNEAFQTLVDQIKATKEPGFTDAIFLLYDLAGNGADQLVAAIEIAKHKTAADGKPHDIRLIYRGVRAGVTILSDLSPDKINVKLMGMAKLGKYKSKADQWLAIGCLEGSGNLVDAVAFTKEPWAEDATMDEFLKEHFRSGTGIRLSPRKLGRNDLCPCGSGKKFKRCHGRP